MKRATCRYLRCLGIAAWFLLLTPFAGAQSRQGQALVDSLLQELKRMSPGDTGRTALLLDLAFESSSISPAKGLIYGAEALQLARSSGNARDEAVAYYNLGANHCVMGNYPKALDCWLRAVVGFEDLGDSIRLANAQLSIGKVYVEQRKVELAIHYYEQALAVFEQWDDQEGVAYVHGDMGTAYFMTGKYPDALMLYRKALAEHQEIGNQGGVAVSMGNVANTLMKMGRYQEALPQFFKAAGMYESRGDRNNYMITLGNIGECYLHIGSGAGAQGKTELKKAVTYLQRCLEIATALGNQTSRQSYSRLLSRAEELTGDYQAALGHFQNYTSIRDSVFSIENSRMIENLTTARDTLLRRKDMELQNRKLAVARLEKRSERLYFLAAFLLLSGAVATGFFHLRTRTRTMLLKASIQGEEEERFRIASELHDDVGATLSSVRLFLTQAEQKSDAGLIRQSKEILDESIQKVRDLSHQLQPGALQYIGLTRALESLAEMISRSGSIRMEFLKQNPEWPDPVGETALSVYRIVQELVNNIVKHAGASWIRLSVLTEHGKNAIRLIHDGEGLTEAGYKEQLHKERAIGLKNIENRLKSFKLTLVFQGAEQEPYITTLFLPTG